MYTCKTLHEGGVFGYQKVVINIHQQGLPNGSMARCVRYIDESRPTGVLNTYLLWGPMLDFHVSMMQGYYFDNAKVRPYALLSKGNKQPDHLHQATTCTWTPTHTCTKMCFNGEANSWPAPPE